MRRSRPLRSGFSRELFKHQQRTNIARGGAAVPSWRVRREAARSGFSRELFEHQRLNSIARGGAAVTDVAAQQLRAPVRLASRYA